MAAKYTICVILMIKLVFLQNCVIKKRDKVRHSSNTFKVSSRRNHIKDR